VREEFLDLLRMEPAFREEVRRQLLTDDLLGLPGRFTSLTESVGQALVLLRETVGVVTDLVATQQYMAEGLQRQEGQMQSLMTAQQQTSEQIRSLVTAQQQTSEQIRSLVTTQQQTSEELRWLMSWQRGESGRRDGERYERETLRRAPLLFHGGRGGAPEQPWVQQQLSERLDALMASGMFEAEEDPFLADLVWWKGEYVAVTEISLQVDGQDVIRAAQRAGTLRRAGAQALAVVIGENWATSETREQARARQVAWKVGAELSEDFLTFRRVSAAVAGEARAH